MNGTEFRCELLAGRTEPSSVGSRRPRTEPSSVGNRQLRTEFRCELLTGRERNRVPLGAATPGTEPSSVGRCHPGNRTEFRCELLAGRTEPGSVENQPPVSGTEFR